ncbi:hypothetical protein D3C73_554070 [compost metagenome]
MRIIWLLLYSLACGILLSLYINIQDLIKFAFSLGALFLGIRFFRSNESLGMRIGFILTSIVLALFFSLVYALYKEFPLQSTI